MVPEHLTPQPTKTEQKVLDALTRGGEGVPVEAFGEGAPRHERRAFTELIAQGAIQIGDTPTGSLAYITHFGVRLRRNYKLHHNAR